MKKKFGLLAGLICLGLLCAPVYAEEEKAAKEMDQMVVTATKTETPLREVAASVDVLDREELELRSQPNGDFIDLLRNIPGMTVARAYAPFPATVRMRGGVGQTVILVNGLPVDFKMSQSIPNEIIDRVEIVRGPTSAIYGANATGGVINIITKTGSENLRAEIRGGGGTSGTYRTSVMTEGKEDNVGFAFAGHYGGSAGENVVENNNNPTIHMINKCKYNKSGAAASGKYDFGRASSVTLFYNYWWGDYMRGRVYYGGEWERNYANVKFNQGFNDMFDMQVNLAYHVDDLLHTYDKGGTNYYTPHQRRYTDYEAIPIDVQFNGRFFDGKNTLTLGYFHSDKTEEQDYRDWNTNAELNLIKFSEETWAVYAQDTWKILDNLILSTGIRYDDWKNYDNYFGNYVNRTPDERSEDNWSPKVGLRYNFNTATSVWANYGQGFNTPTATQLYDDRTAGGNKRIPNPDLKPEKTHSYELGADHWFGNIANVKLVGFHTYTEDTILSSFTAANTVTNQNIGKTESTGAELNLDFFITPEWSTGGNYTYNVAEVDENPTDRTLEGKTLLYAPEHQFNWDVTYKKPEDITACLSVRYTGDQHVNDSNEKYNAAGEQLYMNSSWVVDFKATKTILKDKWILDKADFSFYIDNIFNEKYRTMIYYEDPGTTVYSEIALYFD
ncbi:TonB-dependent receptor [Desulfatibacillum aliphaticivorans]|uniref:TonB-dependent receptor n=1 Tax=Desulfatibacillum aliphaticivorans TaxID=218208 RepID=B8FI05_DESAL|nr:TonB-dependent receptor [Desulfatibacillum aliphaticivorans]ACL02572.1 TonB-dependent receptor [Desulfatibacillum aliphaticivorans]